MKKLLKSLIIDFERFSIPIGTFRDIKFPNLPKNVRKSFIYIGMRRSGKTYMMFQKMHELLKQGISRQKILYINFEDDRLQGMSLENLKEILEAYFELYPEYIDRDDIYFFFDEIHEISQWEKFIRRLLDTEKMQIYLSGSSSKLLSTEIATSLRGRTLVREVFPFNFKEYLNHQKVSLPKRISSKDLALINYHLQQFFKRGGFAETIGMDESICREILHGYIDTVIYRDIIERYKVTNTPALRHFLIHALQNPATLFSVNKIYQLFKSLGYSISKNTLYSYSQYFEDAYCLFFVPCFGLSKNKSESKAKKIYPIDQGFISAFSVTSGFKEGQLLETIVFCALRQRGKNIYYYQTKDKKEIDFLVVDQQKLSLLQVSLSLKNSNTKHREISALEKAFLELGIDTGVIVTLNDEETLSVKNGTITVIPLWKFLLKTSDFNGIQSASSTRS